MRLGRRAADLDIDRPPARERHDPERDEIEQKLHLVLRQSYRGPAPIDLMLAGPAREVTRHSLGVA